MLKRNKKIENYQSIKIIFPVQVLSQISSFFPVIKRGIVPIFTE